MGLTIASAVRFTNANRFSALVQFGQNERERVILLFSVENYATRLSRLIANFTHTHTNSALIWPQHFHFTPGIDASNLHFPPASRRFRQKSIFRRCHFPNWLRVPDYLLASAYSWHNYEMAGTCN